MSRGRRRDRLVYLGSHPVLFALLSATRFVPSVRLGRTVLVHGTEAYVDGLTRVPLDRTAAGTTGGVARAAAGSTAGGVVFDEDGRAHRHTRREVHGSMSAGAVSHLAPVWREVLERRLAPLGTGATVDVVDVAVELTGATTAAMLGVDAHPVRLAQAAREAAAEAARDHLKRAAGANHDAARRLIALAGDERAAMLAVAAVNTMVAALPRAVAWCADDHLWGQVTDPALVDELLRLLAPSPLLPRVAAGDGTVGGRRVRRGDRLILVARHAAKAHRAGPVPPRVAHLVFGAGPHACPGARLARAQLADALAAFAVHRPVVVRATVDRVAALPGWAALSVRAG